MAKAGRPRLKAGVTELGTMMRKLALLLAASAAAPATAAPKLLVVLSVDQFSSDLFDEYRGEFRGGLARLAGGVTYRNGFQSHAASETCPGHSTILTGDRPARTGIIANTWYDQSQTRSDKAVYCAEDERVPGSSSSAYTVSARHLKVTTLGERLKAWRPASRTVAIAGKDRAAVMMSGQHPDQRWYWTGKGFATDLGDVAKPAAVVAANQSIAAALATVRGPLDTPASCVRRSRVVPIEGGGKPVGAGRFARAAGDGNGYRASPEFDRATLSLAFGLVGEMKLGRGPAPDLLAVGLSATDYVGHTYGTEGEEMCLQLHALDAMVGDFLGALDRSGIDYAVVLTADHGGNDVPERERLNGLPGAARVDPALSAAAMGKLIGARLGLKGPVLIGDSSFGDMYIDNRLGAADRQRALSAAVAAYRSHPQVAAVFTHAQLRAAAMSSGSPDRWSLLSRARASFDDKRSGDLVVLLKSRVTPIADTRFYVATHGSPYDYDRRVPILFWRKGLAKRASNAAIETIDIMPTLAAMVGLPVQRGSIDGHCLRDVVGTSCSR